MIDVVLELPEKALDTVVLAPSPGTDVLRLMRSLFLQTGAIRDSVNFPATTLPPSNSTGTRHHSGTATLSTRSVQCS